MTKRHLSFSLASLALFLPAAVHAKHTKAQTKPVLHASQPLTPEDRQHLLHDTFTMVKTVAGLPVSVRKQLVPDNKNILDGMADAGQGFEPTDVVSGKLPMRRLVLAAVSAKECLVYFEQGGIGYSQHVALFRLLNGQATRVWEGYLFANPPLTLSELRAALVKGEHQASAASSYRASRSRRNSA